MPPHLSPCFSVWTIQHSPPLKHCEPHPAGSWVKPYHLTADPTCNFDLGSGRGRVTKQPPPAGANEVIIQCVLLMCVNHCGYIHRHQREKVWLIETCLSCISLLLICSNILIKFQRRLLTFVSVNQKLQQCYQLPSISLGFILLYYLEVKIFCCF